MDTLRDAINGNAAAISIIAAESGFTCDDGFGFVIGCASTFLSNVVASLGGTVASATTLLNNALAGNTTALNTIHGALGGTAWASGSYTDDALVADFINTVIAGSGTVGLLTIRQAIAGNANARKVLNHLFDGKFTGKLVASDPTTGIVYLQAGMAAATVADMIAIFDDAIAGDPIALDKIKVALNNLVLYTAAALDATAISYVNGLLASLGGPPAPSDIDGDGIPDVNDPDIDGDGIPNSTDTDDNNDGIPDSAVTDTDGDGIMDSTDTDDDGDGIPDTSDTDDDGDGIPDVSDPDLDTDGDGTPDINDTDDDGDGIPDSTDTDDDGDGVLDTSDPDSGISGATGSSPLSDPTLAMNALVDALGGDVAAAASLVTALGGDPVAALTSIINGTAGSILTAALGPGGAVGFLTGLLGDSTTLTTLTGVLGDMGSISALVSALGTDAAALANITALLSGDAAGLAALTSFLGGDLGALSALTDALGGASGALSALTGALGASGAISALTSVIGASGVVSALTGVLGQQVMAVLGVSVSLCGTKTAPLTGTFATSPCLWTRNTRGLTYAQTYQGGEQVANYLESWWNDEFLPAMKNMTAQLHSSVIDQTRQVGSMHDSISLTRSARKQQVLEFEAKKRVLPNEETCVVGSHSAAAATTNIVSKELTAGFKTDLKLRAGGATGKPSANGPAADIADRWDKYCKYFLNPDTNNGENSCPSPATPGMIVDGDIDIEEFLFRDTIDFDKEENRQAADALLINLLNPIIYERLPDNIIDTATGREIIMKREYLQSVRSIAMDAVSNMLARRVGMPLPTTAGGTNPPMVPPAPQPPPNPTPPPTGAGGTYEQFHQVLRQRESTNRYWIVGGASNKFLGAYQMGALALIDIGCIKDTPAARKNGPSSYVWTGSCGGYPVSSQADFLTGPNAVALQDAAIKQYHALLAIYMQSKGLDVYKCTTVNGIYLTPSGMVAASHLIGAAGLKSCILNPNGPSCKDQFGTKWQEYNALGANYDSPYGGPCSGAPLPPPPPLGPPSAPPPPPKPVGQTIREIRERAGVNPADISDKPSYNEIMVAMTKERFFDPQYYVRMNNDLGAIKQEQTSVNAYIAIQMSDIETMQERINLLLAARASLKYNSQALPHQQDFAPVR